MLENEPEGGELTGSEPVTDPTNDTRTSAAAPGAPMGREAPGGDSVTGDDREAAPAPARRTRRHTSPGATEPAPASAPVEAAAETRTVSGEAADAEVLAPISGEVEPVAKATRRRRKATSTARADKPVGTAEQSGGETTAGTPGLPGGDPVAGTPAGSGPESAAPTGSGPTTPEPSPADQDTGTPPVKVTRTRRRRAAASPTEAPAEAAGASAELAGPDTPETAGHQVDDSGTAAPAADRVTGAGTPPGPPPTDGATRSARRSRRAAAGTGSDAGLAAPLDAEATAAGVETAGPSVAATAGSATAGSSGVTEETGATGETSEPEPRGRRRRAAISAPIVLFMAPEPETPPVRPAAPVEAATADAAEPADTGEAGRRRRRGRRVAESVEPEPETEVRATVVEEGVAELDEEDEDDEEDDSEARRRRRRGRRGRGRGKGTADEAEEEAGEPAEIEEETGTGTAAEEAEAEDEIDGDGVTRRRRRRRRKGAGDTEGAADDGVPTVVKIREPRKSSDEVQGVSGSTRLEAKRQRRRDGREQRRTRPPILSESEFLARREAVDRVMAVRQRGDRTQIAVLEDGVLVEHYVTRNASGTMAGNVFLGKVQNVLPSMEAAFVDVGRGRNAVLYAGEVNWDTSGLEGRARSIEQALRSGDPVLVQVTKDPIGHKGARLTSHIALSGRHLVYVPNGNASGISRKLSDTERKRLRDVLKKLVPDGAGVIVRTAAEGASEDELARDVKRLQAQWEDIQAKAAEGGAPVLLYEEPDLVIRVVRDLFNEDFRELVVQGEEAYEMVESYLSHVSPDLVARLRRHTGTADVFVERRIDEQILKGLDRKVFLPSGGHLVIDRTEAMTVVDVNTGKYTGVGGNLEETVTRNNLEAAEEIVRQLRLRDLGGIVVIDFIDMVLEANRELVLRRLTECLGRDRTKHQVTEITSLGLVQMTRKRIGAGLLEAFSETCECCKGRGLIIHTEPVPEKARPGGGEKVKAVASASTGTAAEPGVARRRGRKVVAPERVVVEVADEEDTMGYDLSRYEVDNPEAADVVDVQPAGSMRLAGVDDPDAVDEAGEPEEADSAAAGGRRRARRGGTRRRTRP